MKTAGIIKTICWALLAVILTGIMVSMIFFRSVWHSGWLQTGWDNLWSYVDDKDTDHYEEIDGAYLGGSGSVNAADIHSIEIEWIDGDIKVAAAEGDQVKFNESAKKELTDKTKLRYKVEGGVLKIRYSKYKNYSNNSMFRNLSKQLTVTVPKELAELEIECVSSDVEVTGLKIGTLDVEAVSGDLTTHNVTAEQVERTQVSGDMVLNGAFRTVKVESVSGEASVLSTVCPQKVKMDSVSGDIIMRIPENDGFRVSKDSASGTLSSDFAGSISKNEMVYKNGGAEFKMSTVSGDITVNRLDADAA